MTSPFSYEGKRVVVTGGYSGVGAPRSSSCSRTCSAPRTSRSWTSRNPTGAAQKFVQTRPQRPGVGGRRDPPPSPRVGPVDVLLFNNAGVAGTLPAPVVFGVNYLGLRRLAEAAPVDNGTLRAGGAIVSARSVARVRAGRARLEDIKALIAIEEKLGRGAGRAGPTPRGRRGTPTPRRSCRSTRCTTRRRPPRRACARQRHLPVADRHAAAAGLPQDDERQGHRTGTSRRATAAWPPAATSALGLAFLGAESRPASSAAS
ncbi:hypothetical protein ACU686_18710, partial [Yinghuangia aomiensis]